MKYTSITHMQCMDAVVVSVLITRYEADFIFYTLHGSICLSIRSFSG